MCGPSCNIEPNRPLDGATKPHDHPVVKRTFGDGFPFHKMPVSLEGLQQPPPKAFAAFERKHGLSRSRGQSTTSIHAPPTLMSVALNEENARRAARLLNSSDWRRRAVELEREDVELRMYSTGQIHQLPESEVKDKMKIGRFLTPSCDEYGHDKIGAARRVGSHGTIRLVPSTETQITSELHNPLETLTAVRRRPAALGPSPRSAVPSKEAGCYFPRLDNGQAGIAYRQKLARSATDAGYRTATHPVVPSPSTLRMRSKSGGSTLVSIPENYPTSAENPDETYTLRHIQRMATNQVQIRLSIVSERCQRFRQISRYEPVNEELFNSLQHLRSLKAMLDENNQQFGGSYEAEESAWQDFLRFLGNVEVDVERENARLRVVRQRRLAEREIAKRKERVGVDEKAVETDGRERQEDEQNGNVDVDSFDGSFATAEEDLNTIYSIPAVQTRLVRSLSTPPRFCVN